MGTIYIKGVTERFDFDSLRISQVHRLVKNKATGTPYGVFIMYSPWCVLTEDAKGRLYTNIGVGLSALLVSTNRAMREPLDCERVTALASRFFVYMRPLFHSPVWSLPDVSDEI